MCSERGVKFMDAKLKLSLVFYSMADLVLVALGFTYSLKASFMPYHAEVIGMSWEQLTPEFQLLIFALMKAFGVTMIALSITGASLIWIPFRKGEKWAKITIPIAFFVYAIPCLWIPFFLNQQTGANTPVMVAVIGNSLTALGLIFSLLSKKQST